MKIVQQAAHCTVEYDTVRGVDAIVVNPFPMADPDSGFWLTGTIEELRGVVDTMNRLLDDLEDP